MAKLAGFGVVGSGAMGSGIAQVGAQSGFPVTLFDISEAQLEKARSGMQKSLTKLEEKGVLKESAGDILKRLNLTTQLQGLKGCDFVVEAATENREIKFKLFRDLDTLLDPKAILCSNTSSISITEIAGQTKRPELVAGMHFMNPVPLMKLVEGIRGMATSDAC
ncbi:MAG: 3-hydroxybutyryl-CoA dehydrogenase, partial [Bdellovibrionales bacterium]|nr:3-hydroxybutyryl-CoA dehydrogenase [Bdellovibrionales bacterium]